MEVCIIAQWARAKADEGVFPFTRPPILTEINLNGDLL
jgi:hypothetical protein